MNGLRFTPMELCMEIEVYVTSAFSKDNRGGNIAGVVLQDFHLNEAEKTKIAYKLGYSETVFVCRSEQADLRLEYFTPNGEVPLCGHATVATFVVLNQLKILNKSEYIIETKSGLLRVDIDADGLIFMEQNLPQFYEELSISDIGECFCEHIVEDSLPIQIVSTGLRDIMVPVRSLEYLNDMSPDLSAISKLSDQRNCVGIHAFTLVKKEGITAVCRNFAPLYGINEESATGTSNCALACYLYKQGIKHMQYIFEQGYNLKSISQIYVNIDSKQARIQNVSVGGYGYLVSKKTVRLYCHDDSV